MALDLQAPQSDWWARGSGRERGGRVSDLAKPSLKLESRPLLAHASAIHPCPPRAARPRTIFFRDTTASFIVSLYAAECINQRARASVAAQAHRWTYLRESDARGEKIRGIGGLAVIHGLNRRGGASRFYGSQRVGLFPGSATTLPILVRSQLCCEVMTNPVMRGTVATAGPPAALSGLASLVLATGHTTKRQREKTARNRHSRTINPFRRCNAVL